MTTTLNANGQQRKSLAAQIDRLDSVLDGLADGIEATVVAAVQEAVGQAVRAAVQATLTEVLTNPELQQRLRPSPSVASGESAPVFKPVLRRAWGWRAGAAKGAWDRVAAVVRLTWSQAIGAVGLAGSKTAAVVGHGVAAAGTMAQRACRRAKALLVGGWLRAWALYQLARRLGRPALAALGVGAAVAVGCYLAGPAVASVVSGLTSLLLTLVAAALRSLGHLLHGAGGGNVA
jgi:hypothetical protein